MSKVKLSPAQRKVLELLGKGGKLHYWSGIEANAFVTVPNGMTVKVHISTAFCLSHTALLQIVDKDWRRTIYEISDAGRVALPPAPAALPVTDEPGGSGARG